MAKAKVDKLTYAVESDRPALLEPVRPANRFGRWVPAMVVFVLAVVVYIPSLSNSFVSWDDDHYIYNNRQLVHPKGLNDIWTNTKYSRFKQEGLKKSTHQYYPLLFTTFWVQHQVYHRINNELLFSLPVEMTGELGQDKPSEALKREFADRDIPIPKPASVIVVETGRRWLIARVPPYMGHKFYNAVEGYGVRLEDGKLNVYSGDPAIFEYDNEAWGIHAVNTILHGITAVVMLLLLRRLGVGVWVAWVVVALFAVHPMNVASVAWATERKNILSLLFYMLALLCYLRHRRNGGWLAYLGTFILFQGALYSKTVALTFPFVLMLTDLLVDRQWNLKRAVLRGIPFLLVTVAAFAPTLLVTRTGYAKFSLTLVVLATLIGVVTVCVDRQLHRRLTVRSLAGLVPTVLMFGVACAPTLLLGNRLLFSVDTAFQRTLDSGSITKELWSRLKHYDVVSRSERPADATVSVKEPGKKWVITTSKRTVDPATKQPRVRRSQRFTIELADQKLNVYQTRWYPAGVWFRFAPLWAVTVVIFLINRAAGGRLDVASLLRIAPLLVLAVLAADTTMYMEDRARLVPLMDSQRPFVIPAATWFYVLKLLVPIGQLPITPLWNPYPLDPNRWNPGGDPVWWLPLLGLFVVGWALFHWRKKIPPHFLWGLGFYVVTQLPMLGFKNINIFQFAFVHEHYIYNGALGVLLMFAILLDVLRKRLGAARNGTRVVTGLVCGALIVYGLKTATYSKVWESAESFWMTTLEGNERCWAGWYNLGNMYKRQMDVLIEAGKKEKAAHKADKAIEFYKGAVKAKEDLTLGYNNLLRLLDAGGHLDDMEEYANRLMRYLPGTAHRYLGIVHYRKREFDDTEAHFLKALEYDPNDRQSKAYLKQLKKRKQQQGRGS